MKKFIFLCLLLLCACFVTGEKLGVLSDIL